MPISAALSTETSNSLILIVSSSMSSRLTRMSPASTTPLSSTRSSRSARFAGCGRPAAPYGLAVEPGRGAGGSGVVPSLIATPLPGPGLTLQQALDQLVLPGVGLVVGDLPGPSQVVDPVQFGPDHAGVVVLPLGLPQHLLGDPDRSPDRERQPEQPHDSSQTRYEIERCQRPLQLHRGAVGELGGDLLGGRLELGALPVGDQERQRHGAV